MLQPGKARAGSTVTIHRQPESTHHGFACPLCPLCPRSCPLIPPHLLFAPGCLPSGWVWGSVPRERCGGAQRPPWPSGNTGPESEGKHPADHRQVCGYSLGGWPVALGVWDIPEGQEQDIPKPRPVPAAALADGACTSLGASYPCGAHRPHVRAECGGQGRPSGVLSPTLEATRSLGGTPWGRAHTGFPTRHINQV